MRDAAEKAGIPRKQLRIALEPEAASVYCQYLPIERLDGAEKGFTVTRKGTRYMVIDLGGGTADITLHEKIGDGKLKELDKASGGASGGTAVDENFFSVISDIVGEDVQDTMKSDQRIAYIDLCREFESAKRKVKPELDEKVNLSILYHLNQFCSQKKKGDFPQALKKSVYSKSMVTFADKLRIDSVLLRKLFQPVINNILSCINSILKQKTATGVKIILLVGGFSESNIVQEAIKKEYPNIRVVVPYDASLSVVKGAVIFGHLPNTIDSRIMKYTYCVTYPEDGVATFKILVEAGVSVPLTHYVTQTYTTKQEVLPVKIYYSNHRAPTSTKECWLLAEMEIPAPQAKQKQMRILAQYIFGDTELIVNAIDTKSSTPFGTRITLK